MTITLPNFKSLLSQPLTANNFIAYQSASLSVSNSGASGSQSVTFTAVPTGGQRVTFKITNSGTKGCYIASGAGAATAVASSSTPTPTSGTAVSTCDFIAAGAILTQDFVPGTDTIAAICAGTDTTTLEISSGSGQ